MNVRNYIKQETCGTRQHDQDSVIKLRNMEKRELLQTLYTTNILYLIINLQL